MSAPIQHNTLYHNALPHSGRPVTPFSIRVMPSTIKKRVPSVSKMIGVYLSQSKAPCLASLLGSANGRDDGGISFDVSTFLGFIAARTPEFGFSPRFLAAFAMISAASSANAAGPPLFGSKRGSGYFFTLTAALPAAFPPTPSQRNWSIDPRLPRPSRKK